MQMTASKSANIIKPDEEKSLFMYMTMDRNNNSWPATQQHVLQMETGLTSSTNHQPFFHQQVVKEQSVSSQLPLSIYHRISIHSVVYSVLHLLPPLSLSLSCPPLSHLSSPAGWRTDWRGSQMKRGAHQRPTASSQLTYHSIRQPPTNGIIS